jgi:hypothetical protein
MDRITMAVLLIAALGVQHGFAEEMHHGGPAEQAVALGSMDDAVNAVAFFSRRVDSNIKNNELDKIHASAFAAADAASSSSQFATSLTADQKTQLEAQIARVKALAKMLDKYGDAGKALEASNYAAKLREESEAMQKLTGITAKDDWIPRTSEGTAVLPHSDHSPKHGGVFFMAPGQYYHLEGVYPTPGDFRVYMYDDRTRSIAVKGISGKVTFKDKEYDLVPNTDVSYLMAHLPSDATLPVTLSAKISLPDPKTTTISVEQFDFDFDKLTGEGESHDESTSGMAAPVHAVRKTR